jgi:hypothetical protein
MAEASSPDPHEDLVNEIAEQLQEHNQYTADLDPSPHQRIIDLRWASLLAGRRLGVRTRMHVTGLASSKDQLVRVTVVCVDALGHVAEVGRTAVRSLIHRP